MRINYRTAWTLKFKTKESVNSMCEVNADLRLDEALEILNQLNEYKVYSEGDGETLLLHHVSWTPETEKLLNRLGFEVEDMANFPEREFKDRKNTEEAFFDITFAGCKVQERFDVALMYDGNEIYAVG